MKLEDCKVGLTIKYEHMQGQIQFISDQYITFCVSEQEVTCKLSKYKTTKCCLIVFPHQLKDCTLINTNETQNTAE